MTLEQRLRSELHRAAPDTLASPPTVDSMHATVGSRRRRNRIVTGTGAALAAVAVTVGVAVAVLPDDSTDVIASAPEAETDAAVAADTPTDAVEPVAGENDESTGAAADTADEGARSLVEAPAADTTRTEELPVADVEIGVTTRESAVEFAGGSGVLLVRIGDGYAGIAGRFGGAAGITSIGLTSPDGLDWAEVPLSGVPAGATATALVEHDGTYVALFSQFDVDAQRNNSFVGTSTDLAAWSLAPALPGDDTIATGLAAGPMGVLVIGVAPQPAVWIGDVGGPYTLASPITAADTIAGVVAIESGFVAVGTSSEFGPTLFDSVDGAEWVSSPMSSLGDDDTVVSLSVSGSTIMLAGDDGDTGWTATSSDGGQAWLRSELDSGMVSTVAASDNTISFLGTSPLGSTMLTLSDGSTWSSAEIDVTAPDRVQLLVAGSDEAVLLATIDGTLTWIVAER